LHKKIKHFYFGIIDICVIFVQEIKTITIMANNSSSASGGIGFAGLLTIVFIVLKLLGKITWSWIWVLSPLWISFALGVIIIIIVGILYVISRKW
jgi:hypothetical protein